MESAGSLQGISERTKAGSISPIAVHAYDGIIVANSAASPNRNFNILPPVMTHYFKQLCLDCGTGY